MKPSFALSLTLGAMLAATASAQDLMSPELLWKLERLSGGSLSPDGQWVLYSVRNYKLAENKGDADLYLVPIGGGDPVTLTDAEESEADAQWVKTPSGTRLFFTTKRGEDESSQVYSLNPEDQSLTKVTDIEGGVSNLKVSPTGQHLAFTRDIKLDSTVADLYPDLPEADARIIDGLLYRHWNVWHDFKYTHVHVAPLGEDGKAGDAVDIMEGMKFDCPVPPFGGSEQFNWSPDGKEIAYTLKISNNPAESTDTDVYLMDVLNPGNARCITTGMDGYDMEPSYSPDGRYLAFLSMERPGFESDRNRIMIYDRQSGTIDELTRDLDQMAHDAVWAPDSQSLYFRSEWRGTDQLFHAELESRRIRQVTEGVYNWSLRDVSANGQTLVVARRNMIRPWELGTLPAAGGEYRALTDVNGEIYAKLSLPTVKERWVRATDGKMIHNWVIYPPDFDATRRYPMLTYCQGGPQGQIGQWFSYRWNFHLMAAQGYVVLAVNRRGLPGFGQEWNDQISGDWAGQAMQDILAATDDMFTEPYIDHDRTGAIGASFGGYTVYWMMGNHDKRFCAMVSHAGLFNLESFYGATEELFFPNWDIGGPYWESAEMQGEYDVNSPHRFIGNWNTPLLVIHGEQDFRVPYNQGMEAFTAAKLKGVPARFLYYPNEGHWVQSPQNGVLWHRVFFEWLDRYCKSDA